NTNFEVERSGHRSDFNLDFRLLHTDGHKFVVRPRAYTQYQEIDLYDENPARTLKRNRGKIDLTEFYLETWVSGETSFTLGLQNFQCGLAERHGPRNPQYHFNREQRSLLRKEKG